MALAAANAYIGLLVGLTVSASIPAAAVSMGVLASVQALQHPREQPGADRGVGRRDPGSRASSSPSPALVILGAWGGYEYGPMLAIAVVGGIMGVAFTVPLRRALIVEAKLRFPKGVATAEVLKTGGIETHEHHTERSEEASIGFRMLLQAAGLGAAHQAPGVGLRAAGQLGLHGARPGWAAPTSSLAASV